MSLKKTTRVKSKSNLLKRFKLSKPKKNQKTKLLYRGVKENHRLIALPRHKKLGRKRDRCLSKGYTKKFLKVINIDSNS